MALKDWSGRADARGMATTEFPPWRLAPDLLRVLPLMAWVTLLVPCFGHAAEAAWPRAGPGSWVAVESWNHELGERKPMRVTTTLVRRQGGVSWFEHRDASGAHWLDTDGRSANDAGSSVAGQRRERLLATTTLHLDGRPVLCRVVLTEVSTAPFLGGHAVREWISRHKRWEAVDSTLKVRVLKRADLGLETRYRDGDLERSRGLWTESVRTLHDRVRVRGRSYDCWVVTRKLLTESGEFAERSTTWRFDGTPTGWVKRLTETRDPHTGAMARVEQRLVDFRYQ